MAEEKPREEKNKLDRPLGTGEDTWLVRQSGQPPLTSLDQISYNYNTPGANEEGFNVREIWRKVRKRKWLILTIAVIATTIVSIEAFRTKSIYQAAAKVALNRDNATVVKLGGAVLETDDSDRIRTDLLLLETYPLLEEVVVRLKLDQNPAFLDIGGRKSVVESVTTILASLRGGESAASSGPASTIGSQDAAPPLQETARTKEESERLAPYVETLKAYLLVEQIPDTRAIRIMFTHTDPAIASQVANGVADVFVNYSFSNKTEKYNKSATWLETATRKLMAQMQQADQELANYSRANGIFSTDEKQNLVADKLTNLYGQALKAETDRIIKQSLFEEVRQGRVGQLPEAFSDGRSTQLQAKLGDLQVQAAQLSTRYGPDNPKLVEVQQQIAQLQQLLTDGTKNLEARLKADYDRAARDERLIKESLERAKGEAIQQNQASIKFNILRQNAETAKSLYNDFLQKTNQANIQLAEQNKDLRIIEPARNGALIGPRRTRAILIGFLLSLLAGVGLALLLEYLDNTVKNIEDVTRATQLPTLALIPTMNASAVRTIGNKQRELNKASTESAEGALSAELIGGLAPRGLQPQGTTKVATLDALSTVVEAYRMLRTSVLLSTAGTPPKTIMVTSSQPGEGKTTTAVNTAISLAQLGSSVLIIDADLRRPAVHKTFKMQNIRGLSNYLSSKTPIENLIINLPTPCLAVLPCGPIPPNPAELISSDRMKELLRYLCERYDHIIIDSPPLISVTDPVILSTMVDGAILVVQAGKSSRDLVRRARQELAGVGAKIFGVVLNNVDVRKEGYDDYYYYRYNSSYAENQKGASAG